MNARMQMLIGLLWSATAASPQSLYDERSFKPLTADQKAMRVGDALTIQVIESAMAIANADTGTQRRNTLGAEIGVHGSNSRAVGASVNLGGDFDGGGRTERAGKLVAQLTVTVRDVLANGDLMVSGEQQLTINDERQRISVSGRVRVLDINEANVVLSSRIAEADITYVGDGRLADRQRPAWWRRLLDAWGF